MAIDPQNVLGPFDLPTNDPPPPYPSPERRVRTRRSQRHPQRATTYISTRSTLSSLDSDAFTEQAPHLLPSETTPLLRSASRRHRASSHASSLVSPASFTRTVISFCRDPESEPDIDIVQQLAAQDTRPQSIARWSRHKRAWARYFRPMRRRAYHAAIFHLMVVNFPYALIAWIYLFIFTLAGTTLLVTLPLGALLCFLDLLGARAFARGELALQTKFHGPLASPPPYPPRPIFHRVRPPEISATESGPLGVQYETSFYKNTYAMFTDATTYQALFYFLVIKPGITLCISMALIVLVPVSYVLVLPAPLMLRFVRRLGIWQANVAVEGLYYRVT